VTRAIAFALVALVVDVHPHAYSMAEAERLAARAVRVNDPKPLLEPYSSSYGGHFYYFEELNPNPNGSAHVATIAVNRRTGDVWDVAGSVCHLIAKSKNAASPRGRLRSPAECDEISN
jgi:hypothetical protein